MLSKPLVGATLRPLVLTMLSDGPKYGFQIAYRAKQLAEGQITWPNSKLYPLLHKLEAEGLVDSYWEPSESGPDRKYYRITPRGQGALQRAQEEWRLVNALFVRLWGPGVSVA